MKILLTGGSACGKSVYAERLAAACPGPWTYVAAMRPYGAESEQKIARHRAMRAGKGFSTVERYTDLAGLRLAGGGTVLVECLCNLTANEMFDEQGRMYNPVPAVLEGLDALAAQCENIIVVTNDVGSSGQLYREGTLAYIRALGQINAAVAARFDTVWELVCGIPLLRKGTADMPSIEPPSIERIERAEKAERTGKEGTAMTLITGAAASGKRTYVKSLGYREEDMSPEPDSPAPVLVGLENLVYRNPMAAEELLPRLLEKEVVVCDEVGGGIIPADYHERMSREQTGRLCVLLAQRAARVVRLVCGIPIVLK